MRAKIAKLFYAYLLLNAGFLYWDSVKCFQQHQSCSGTVTGNSFYDAIFYVSYALVFLILAWHFSKLELEGET